MRCLFLLLLSLLTVSPALAATIDQAEGVDLLVVLPGSWANFDGPYAIPADFFGPGSDPFIGNVLLQAAPLEPEPLCQGGSPDPGNIIVRRDPFMLADPPATVTVPVEIVQLKLVSSAPITVTYNGGMTPEQWDIEIVPLPLPQPPPPRVRQFDLDRDEEFGGEFHWTYEYDSIVRVTRTIPTPDPPIETTPPTDPLGGQGRWGIPAILPERSGLPASGATLSCPSCKTDDFYIGFDGVQAQPFWLSGQFLNLYVIIPCEGSVPTQPTTWGAVKHLYQD